MNLHLDKKIIIVTGGAKGIEEGIVKARFQMKNAIPVIVGRNGSDNLKKLETIDNNGFQVVAELTKPEECEHAIKKIIEKYNHIDGLVNNAGINDGVGLEKIHRIAS
jgi:L-fucose dehydrogenase